VTRYLFIGRFIERKGIDVLVDAFRRLDGGELWIAGEGPLDGLVASAASADPRIRLMGYADGEGLADLYRQADVLVVPSLYEPWGLVVHEGLAWGLPVIVTDEVGAADDLIDHGVNGYVVPPGSAEALAGVMKAAAGWTSAQWTESGRRSGELLETCSIDRAADAYIHGCRLGLEHRRRLRAA
jgi:glycosyltransferase involved in cell wall biosynthesis